MVHLSSPGTQSFLSCREKGESPEPTWRYIIKSWYIRGGRRIAGTGDKLGLVWFACRPPERRENHIVRNREEPITILIADDDEDDRLMAEKALAECRLKNHIHFVKDGEELMDYLHHRGRYADEEKYPLPGLILLDLNMPKKDGCEALAEIKSDPTLRRIPVVVLTTSRAEEDILRTYDLGVNSYITKPVNLGGLADAMKVLNTYWFQIVKLPNGVQGD